MYLADVRVKAIRMLSEAEKSGQCLLRASAMDWPPLLSPDSLTETAVISALRRQLEEADGQVGQSFVSLFPAIVTYVIVARFPLFQPSHISAIVHFT